MLVGIFLLVLAAGALAAGIGHVRKARAMRGFRATTGRILTRDVVMVAATREGVWGKGGGWSPAVSYHYEVGGRGHTGDRIEYIQRGYRRSIAEQQAAAFPDEVEVWYDPRHPEDAYLRRHRPGLGWGITAVGVALLLAGLVALAGA